MATDTGDVSQNVPTALRRVNNVKNISYKKKQWRPPGKKKKNGGKNLRPRNRKACHSTSKK
jgi:hypothetical protein